MRAPRRILTFVVAVGAVVALGACSNDSGGAVDSGKATTTTAAGGSAASGPVLTIQGTAFGNKLRVNVGQKVTVVNKDGFNHTVTADDGSFRAALSGNDTKTFDAPAKAGTYPFHCEIHSSMKSELIVT